MRKKVLRPVTAAVLSAVLILGNRGMWSLADQSVTGGRWRIEEGKRYYETDQGEKITGIQIIGGKKYAFGSDGALIKPERKNPRASGQFMEIDGESYYVYFTGEIAPPMNGWVCGQEEDGEDYWYYINGTEGCFKDTYKRIGGKLYLFDERGCMISDELRLYDGLKVYFARSSDGAAVEDKWIHLEDGWYYFHEQSIGAVTGNLGEYTFDENGVLISENAPYGVVQSVKLGDGEDGEIEIEAGEEYKLPLSFITDNPEISGTQVILNEKQDIPDKLLDPPVNQEEIKAEVPEEKPAEEESTAEEPAEAESAAEETTEAEESATEESTAEEPTEAETTAEETTAEESTEEETTAEESAAEETTEAEESAAEETTEAEESPTEESMAEEPTEAESAAEETTEAGESATEESMAEEPTEESTEEESTAEEPVKENPASKVPARNGQIEENISVYHNKSYSLKASPAVFSAFSVNKRGDLSAANISEDGEGEVKDEIVYEKSAVKDVLNKAYDFGLYTENVEGNPYYRFASIVNPDGTITIKSNIPGTSKVYAEIDGVRSDNEITITIKAPESEKQASKSLNGLKDQPPAVALNQLKQMNKTDLMEAITSNKADFQQIDDNYMFEHNIGQVIETDPEIAARFDGKKLSIVGAALNADEGENIVFKMSEPSGETDLSAINKISKVPVDLSLIVNDSPKSELDIPVLVTTPFPEGMSPSEAELYHIHDGQAKKLDIHIDSSGRTASFATGSFSTFVFAAGNPSSGGSSGGGGGSSSSGSSKAVQSTGEAGTWIQDETGWWFKRPNGSYPASAWLMTGNAWYRFDDKGYMITGWYTDENGRKYYLNPVSDGTRGAMKTGWQSIDEKWYYFSTASDGYKGSLQINTTTPDGYKVGPDGVWISE